MTGPTLLATLRTHPFVAGFAPGHVEKLAALAGDAAFVRDHVVFHEGDELGWSALLMATGKHFQARALEPVTALAFNGPKLLAACTEDPAFGFAFMYRLLGVVAGRLQSTRLQVHDMYSPVAKRAGT